MNKRKTSLVLTVSYNGARYSGFAKQKDENVKTVQGKLEQALATLFRRPIETVCAGRTDAGVHAREQFVSFVLDTSELESRTSYSIGVSMNALTPDDIVIKRVQFAAPEFSARFDAVSREYHYRIVCGPTPPLFLSEFAWWRKGSLDVSAMRKAASCLVGEHDFKSFCKAASAEGKTTMRRIESIELVEEEHLGESCLTVRIVGNAFLHSMVRTIIGTLVQVGAGNRDASWVAEVLEARDRSAAGETAPAQGLVFWHVTYPPGLLSNEMV